MTDFKDGNENYITFEKDKLAYCKKAYLEASKRNDQLRETNVQNRLFYEGVDPDLEERAQDPDVQRSSIFIPYLKPAIDTRIADPITRIDERDEPLTVRSPHPTAPKEILEQAAEIQRKLNRQLRDCGYFSNGLKEHIQGAEIYRSPSAVEVGWRKTYKKVATKRTVPKTVKVLGAKIPVGWKTIVEFKTVESGEPFVEWRHPEEWLYQPNRPCMKESVYTIKRMWLDRDEFQQTADEYDWDDDGVKKALAEWPTDEEPENTTSQKDEVEQEKEVPFEKGFFEGKILIAETYVCTYSDGKEVVKCVTTAGNTVHLKTEERYKGIRFPFVTMVSNKLPGTMEQLSTIDIGRPFQKLINELHNLNIDGLAYRLFAMILKRTGTVFTSKPKYGYGKVIEANAITEQDIRLLNTNQGPAPDLLATINIAVDTLRTAVNAPDIMQSEQGSQYEKATSTKIRAGSFARRANPTNKQYGLAIIEVAEIVIALNQQFADDAETWVLEGGMVIDCPSLTNISDPETEKQDWMMLLANALQNPLYAMPAGQRKLRAILEEMMRKFIPLGVERYVPTEEELNQQLEATTLMANLETDKMGIMGEMAAEQGIEQKGATNGAMPSRA